MENYVSNFFSISNERPTKISPSEQKSNQIANLDSDQISEEISLLDSTSNSISNPISNKISTRNSDLISDLICDQICDQISNQSDTLIKRNICCTKTDEKHLDYIQRYSSSDMDDNRNFFSRYLSILCHLIAKMKIRPFYYAQLTTWLMLSVLLMYDPFFMAIFPDFLTGWNLCKRPATVINETRNVNRLCGNTSPQGLYDPLAPWSLIAFDYIAMFSGKFIITTTGLLFITKCKCTWNSIAQRTRFRNFFDTVRQDNWDCHIIGGWTIGICIMLHIWAHYLPSIFHDYKNVYQTWEECQGIAAQQGALFQDQENDKLKSLRWGFGDFGSLCGMSITFLLAFPFSRKVADVNYSLMMWLHMGVSFFFVFELARRQTHPQVWFLNAPIILLYVGDTISSRTWYRQSRPDKVYRVTLDDKYMLMMWNTPDRFKDLRNYSDIYWMKRQKENRFEWAHPFTCASTFKMPSSNIRSIIAPYCVDDPTWEGHVFTIRPETTEDPKYFLYDNLFSINEDNAISFENEQGDKRYKLEFTSQFSFYEKREDIFHENFEEWNRLQAWDQITIVRIHDKNDVNLPCPIRQLQHHSWTKALYDDANEHLTLDISGPFCSDFMRISRCLKEQGGNFPMYVIGTGAGAGLVLDVISHILFEKIILKKPVKILYTATSIALLQFVSNTLLARQVDNLKVSVALTRINGDKIQSVPTNQSEFDRFQLGDLDFKSIIGKTDDLKTKVFFCGSDSNNSLLQTLCHQKGLDFIGSVVEGYP